MKLHDIHGEEVLFVLSAVNHEGTVWLETEGDTDMREEISERFQDAIENGTDQEPTTDQ